MRDGAAHRGGSERAAFSTSRTGARRSQAPACTRQTTPVEVLEAASGTQKEPWAVEVPLGARAEHVASVISWLST